ncbi:probable pectinesterase 29 [Diospyros lotus]|uniref:probable pectinesterase 29 n=1 Tax=Diospyros lotus TaxID=55363 RepID=UPI00225807E3|nr:probable pectinesterase 29 [Diospyros lotus]
MPCLRSILQFFALQFLSLGGSKKNPDQAITIRYDAKHKPKLKHIFETSLVVDQSGHGNFTAVQAAIDSVKPNNHAWARIQVKAGVYSEKVTIPSEKQFIFLEGESRRRTVIQWGDAGSVAYSSTFTLLADNFVAKNIAFKNTYNLNLQRTGGTRITWAPAATIQGDKASFYHCSFSSLQDTLSDSAGRHYFHSCLIEGAVDFIWGSGQSVYQNCTLNTTVALLGGGPGYITAQGRNSAKDRSGFVFKSGRVVGTGPAFLGRAYGAFSRVVFFRTSLADVIAPEGWSAWFHSGQE